MRLMEIIEEFFKDLYSMCVAILRLLFLCATLLMSGLQIVIFTRTEVCNVEMRGMPWRVDREKDLSNLAFIDKVCLENPDLLDYAERGSDFPPEDTEDGEDSV